MKEVTKDDVNFIFKDNEAHKTGYLLMEDFYGKLSCWKEMSASNSAGPKGIDEGRRVDEEAQRLITQHREQKESSEASVAGQKRKNRTALSKEKRSNNNSKNPDNRNKQE
jgi:hypothetical protein